MSSTSASTSERGPARVRRFLRALGPGLITGTADDDPCAIATYSAGPFYTLIAAEIVVGVALDFLHVNPVRLLFLAAVVNGVLAPPLLALVVAVANNRAIMGEHVNGRMLNVLGVAITIVAAIGAIALLVNFV